MGYSLQYCLNECGNAVPGNECDWEDGVCPACRERREDAAKGEAMSGWTKEDTGALRGFHGMRQDSIADAIADESFAARAAAHIEALEARVAELEGPCSFCLETPGHGASKPICDGCAQLATDQAKTSRDLVERIANLEAERAGLARELRERIGGMYRGGEIQLTRERSLAAALEHMATRLEQTASAKPADTIPCAVLVSALADLARYHRDCRDLARACVLEDIVRATEAGTFPPKPKEGT